MNCWHCQTELIWGGDHSVEELKPILAEEYVEVYFPNYDRDQDTSN
tara:strand:- start:7 stop:144 length:138 start_codon:yes stop_codon:yes gene_type:complete